MSGEKYLPVTTLSQQRGRGDDKYIENCAKKRRVENSYGKHSTLLSSAVKSVTNSLKIEGFKDKDGPVEPTGRPINMEGQNGLKEEGTASEDHTTDSV